MKPSPPGIIFGAPAPASAQAKFERRAAIVRATHRAPGVPTLAQTICLLSLSRGEQPPVFPPSTRREMLRKQWITPGVREPGATGRRHDITDAGRVALAGSPWLAKAQRAIDEGKQAQPWK
jgi:hypothetical protein